MIVFTRMHIFSIAAQRAFGLAGAQCKVFAVEAAHHLYRGSAGLFVHLLGFELLHYLKSLGE